MPAVSPSELVTAILDAVHESGYGGLRTSAVRTHPRKFALTGPGDEQLSLWVYAWTLTHGGRPQLPHEYRIQMTSVSSPLPLNPLGLTILIGYDPDLRMFAGFDLARHDRFTEGSPSVQIDIRVVRRAQQDGLAFDRKENGELAVGIRPDQVVAYARNAARLHRDGADPRTFRAMETAVAEPRLTSEEISELDEQLAGLAQPRQAVVREVRRLARAANFRQQVLFAYGNRCAITRIQLKLVDAAHILPVGAPGSIDHVRNGIALSPTYHRAYDFGLIYLDESYIVKVNDQKADLLASQGLADGLGTFCEPLGKILLPPDRSQWPSPRFIRRANSFRCIF